MKLMKSVSATKDSELSVFIAVPITNYIDPETTWSLFETRELLAQENIASELNILAYGCHVDDQRNFLVREFLESDCNVFVFIDSDVSFQASDFLKLIRYENDVVAGIYPFKQDRIDFPVRFLPGEIWSDEDGLVEVLGVPTGFLKINRCVFEKLYEIVPKYSDKLPQKNKIGIPLIFERTMTGSDRYGGDYEFCRKWKKLGGKIYIDPEMSFGHVGSKSYTGSLGFHLRNKAGLTDKYIVDLCRKMESRTIKDLDFGKLMESWDNGYAVPPIELLVSLNDIVHSNDGVIFETGTGLSTLIFGSTGRAVVSLENQPIWSIKTQNILDKCGYNNVEIKTVPMKDGWYDFEISGDYGLIFVDGPARSEGTRSKIVSKLPRLSKGCIVVVDDVDAGQVTDAFTQRFGIEFLFYDRFAIGQYKGE